MKKALLVIGMAGIGVALYDNLALVVNSDSGTTSLPFVWQGPITQYVSEMWLALISIMVVLIAIFAGV